ncbi:MULTISPECIES: polyprenol phosphomannose-dependent alpha 1,6 mannosyltransferase MptB [Arthrobacter]|uniref:Polyprenol phosphomannose-dependent alpha 1,6 mannosyltransferase MptB n=2 Tax=Arthrobacter TaxID=1663 RepID=A0ABU9KGZ8_9MICC|nr:polyprenol phosphomannose-dependent alpha 1,6 mannosyltransferase MptB [Arthrobacter sp. YJM1]MDP5225633.1 polyprenol phosphomannose-dependent alpha 1,6 mannosyltransferase MptB [Arthrobacter sp. YJM1]
MSAPKPATTGVEVALRQGLVGSLMATVGSIGIGWLAGSSFLIRTWPFIVARTTLPAVIVCTVLVCAGIVLLLRAWLRLGQRIGQWTPEARPVLKKALWYWVTPLVFAVPLFSRDMYAYIGQGRLMLEGLDPYTNGISSLSNYFNLGPDTLWTEAPTPYGPLWLWIEFGAVAISGGAPEPALLIFRLFGVLGVLMLFRYVPRITALVGVNSERALWLVVLNPVLLINFVASGHNDALMMGLVTAGLYYAATRRGIRGVVLVTASIAVKPITLLALPFAGLLWAGRAAGWPRRFLYWGATAVLSLGLLALVGYLNGLGFGWLGALSPPGESLWIWFAPVGLLGAGAGFAVNLFGGHGAAVSDVVFTAGKVLSMLVALWLVFRIPKNPERFTQGILRHAAWAFAAVVLMASVIQPWYMVWLLVFFGVTGIADGRQLRLVYYLTAFFVLIALTDQLSVFVWIPIGVVRAVAIAVGAALVLHLVYTDRKTHRLFRAPRFWRRRRAG